MARSTSGMFVVGLVLATGCKHKRGDDEAKGSNASASSGSAVAGAPAAGSAAARTAAGDAVKDLPIVTECPKSLGGTEKVARTITKACGPVTVTDTLTIDGSLTLEAGAILKFQPDTGLVIGYHGAAKLIVKGGDAPDQRVVLTSAGDQAAGVWAGVTLEDGADRSQITGLDIEYAGQAGGAALALHDALDVVFTRSSITHAKDTGVATRGKAAFAQFTGNRFDDIARVAIAVEPGVVGGLGIGNTFGKDEFIEVRGGSLDGDATWNNVGAPYHVIASVYTETGSGPATLTITDATLMFASDAELGVGYHSHGKLRVTGPATFTSLDGKPGTWAGIRIYDGGEATLDGATLSSGGSEDAGVLTVKHGGKLALGEVAFKDNKRGLWADDESRLTTPKPLTFSGNERAARLSPMGLAALTAANVFGDHEILEVSAGELHADATWLTQPKAIVQVLGDVHVDSSFALTVSAGGTYQWKPGSALIVGYHNVGVLKIAGRADAPVVFTALAKGEPWNGVRLESDARGAELVHLELADVGGDGGVTAKAGATGKLDHVSCARCAATVAPACGATLDTAAAVTAGAGTPLAIKKPTGC